MFFFACNNKTSQNKISLNTDTIKNQLKTPFIIDLEKKYIQRNLSFQDIAEVEYIPIETNEDILIGSNMSFQLSKNYFICCNYNSGEFLFFDRKGYLLSKFSHKGGSGEEYQSVLGWVYDEHNKELYINDFYAKKRILIYSSNGHFIRKLNIQEKINNLLNFDDSTLIVRKRYLSDVEIAKTNDIVENYFLLSKRDGGIVSYIRLPLSYKIPTIIVREDNIFYRPLRPNDIIDNGDQFILADVSSDTIYTLNKKNHIKPFIIRKPTIQKSKNTMVLLISKITNKYVFFAKYTLNYESDVPRLYNGYEFAIDMYNNEIFDPIMQNEDFPTNNTSIYCLSSIPTEKNYAAGLYEANVLINALENDELKGALKNVASTLHEDDNPVLMILRFK